MILADLSLVLCVGVPDHLHTVGGIGVAVSAHVRGGRIKGMGVGKGPR